MTTILEGLGQGSFGVVYLLQTPDKAKYALKVVQRTRRDEDVNREARVMSKLNHPHIVRCHAYFKTKSALYLITEYCVRGTLKKFICKQKYHIEEEDFLQMFCQLLDAIEYLHSKKIIHRDLKTDNILLDETKNIKVGDVGVARELDYTTEEAGTFAGAIAYMSPEMHAGRKYTYKTDIWSLGCCAHEMMTLERTFQSLKDLSEMDIPAMPTEVYSPKLRTLILLMLQKEPEKRPSAYEILDQVCKIRGKEYEFGSIGTSINITVAPIEIWKAVTFYEEQSAWSTVYSDTRDSADTTPTSGFVTADDLHLSNECPGSSDDREIKSQQLRQSYEVDGKPMLDHEQF